MGQSREEQRENSTKKMLDAAMREFAKNGYLATTLTDIADHAGVTKGLILARFNSKEELFSAVIKQLFWEYEKGVNEADSFYDILNKMITDIKADVSSKSDQGKIFQLICNQTIPDSCSKELLDEFNKSKIAAVFEKAIREGILKKEENVADICFKFIQAVTYISMGYASGCLMYPSNSEYLRILGFDQQIVKDNQQTIYDQGAETDSVDELRQIEAEQRSALVNSIVEGVNTAYLIDLNSGRLKTLKRSHRTKDIFKNNSEEKQNYEQTMRMQISSHVIEEDRESVIEEIALDNIKKELESKRVHSIVTRDRYDGVLKFVEIRYTRLGEGPDYRYALVGFRNRTEDIIQRKTRYLLAGDDCKTFVLSLDTGMYRVLGKASLHEDRLKSRGNFEKNIEHTFDGVDQEFRIRLKKIFTCDGIREALATENNIEITYHCEGSNDSWRKVEINCINREKGRPTLVAFTFTNLSESTAEQLNYRQRLNDIYSELLQNKAFNEFFLDGFIAAYYVDLENETYKVFRKSGDDAENIVNYKEAMKSFAENHVMEEDREDFLLNFNSEYLQNQLMNNKSYVKSVKIKTQKGLRNYSLQILRGADEKHVAITFTDIEEITREKINQTRTEAFYQRAILEQAISYFRGNISKNEIMPPFVDNTQGEVRIQNFDKSSSFESIIRYLSDNYVSETDRSKFVKHMSCKNLLSCIENKNTMPEITVKMTYPKLGEVFCKFSSFLSRDELNGDVFCMVVVYDVTEEIEEQLRKEVLQKNLEEAKKIAEEANNAKSRFLFNMSHDIRTPMNAMIGFADQAIENIDDKDMVEKYLNKVKLSNDYLLRLINDVLDVARIESGKMVIEEKVWNVKDRIEGLQELFKEQMEEKGINFVVDYSSVKTEKIYMDALRVRQVMSNILSNALKYTPSGGTVKYTVEEKKCDKKGYTVFESVVEDTGIGMTKEFVEHIFEQFSREKNSTESGVQGTGLGMSIVKQLVTLMKGDIKVESEVGKGTKITFTIRFKKATKKDILREEKKEYLEDYDISGSRILLVEDNELNRELAVLILEARGVVVTCVNDGMEAVEFMKSESSEDYDLILMDIQMPRLNGYEATTQIRALNNKKASNIPIIAMTANAFEEDKKEALEAGMNAHIAKPLDKKELVKQVYRLINKK